MFMFWYRGERKAMAVSEQGVFWHPRSRSADAIGAQLAKLPHKINHLQGS